MCAALLTDQRVALSNVPSLVDVSTMGKLLRQMGVEGDLVRVTGTGDVLMAAVLAEGETLLENAAREPEVVDLARCLSAMGARIEGAGSDAMRIEGVASLRGTAHRVMPDRIELGT